VADVPEGARTARDTADVVVARDQARMALDALDAMVPRQAAVLWAREVEGLGYDAIGERFGMTEPAVRSLLSRARKSLRQEYAPAAARCPGRASPCWRRGSSAPAGSSGCAPASTARPGWRRSASWAPGWSVGAVVLPTGPGEPQLAAAPLVAGTSPTGGAEALPLPSAAELPAATEPVVVVAAAPPPPPAPAAPVAPPRATTPLERTGLDDTCVSVGSTGAGGADCAEAPRTRELAVDLPVDASPVGVELPTLSTERAPCTVLPSLPSTRCTTPGEDS
jgi:hypothetical protein